MSLASEWAEAHKHAEERYRRLDRERPGWNCPGGGLSANVIMSGDLMIHTSDANRCAVSPEHAVEFARFILATFGEPTPGQP